MKNKDIAISWVNNNPARTNNYWTDGQNLYSYNLLIGHTLDNQKILYNYTAPHFFQSQTTSRHVSIAKDIPSVEILDPPQ